MKLTTVKKTAPWFKGATGLILSKPIPRQSQAPASAEERNDEKPNQGGEKAENGRLLRSSVLQVGQRLSGQTVSEVHPQAKAPVPPHLPLTQNPADIRNVAHTPKWVNTDLCHKHHLKIRRVALKSPVLQIGQRIL